MPTRRADGGALNKNAARWLRLWRYWVRTRLKTTLAAVRTQFSANLRTFGQDKQLLLWGLALIVGPVVAYAAIGFRLLIGYFQLPWLFTTSERVIAAANLMPWWVIVAAPACAGVAVGWILDRYLPGRRTHSVADVMEARALNDCRIDTKTGIASALTSAMSLGFGASAGREGPVVHLGATFASWVAGKLELVRTHRRALLAAGVAAAISASFNAPIAGVLFAHEVILQHYALRAFVPIVIASVAASVITRFHFGNAIAFIIPDYQIVSLWEFPAFMLLGVVCAVAAILFQLSIRMTEWTVWLFDVPTALRAGLGGLAVGCIALAFPEVLGVGYAATDRALSQHYTVSFLLMLIVAKTIATSITFASRFSTGIFSPSLFIGAMTGSAFGLIATSMGPEASSSASLYAILGMGGVAAAVLGAPISTTMIVFELTGGFSMAVALLVTISIATGLSTAVLGHSFFHWQLKSRGHSLYEGPHKAILRRTTVADFMTPLAHDEEAAQLRAGDAPPLNSTDSLEHALRAYDRSGLAVLPVVDPRQGEQIVAKAQRMAALSAYNRALVDAHEEEHR